MKSRLGKLARYARSLRSTTTTNNNNNNAYTIDSHTNYTISSTRTSK
jgi:hypothetical protein